MLLQCTNSYIKHSYVPGDTTITSSGNDDCNSTSVVAGVLSLVIVLMSGVAAFVIILLLLKIRSKNIMHKYDHISHYAFHNVHSSLHCDIILTVSESKRRTIKL